MSRFQLCVVILTLLPGAAVATVSARASTPLSEVVVTPGPGPKVVATFPADGGSSAAGVAVLKVTFDQPMTPEAWSYGQAEGGAFPTCLARPRLLADQRTFALLCTLAPNQAYALAINETPDFSSDNGRSAKSYLWRFSTTGVGARNMHDALVQAGLTDADEPIMRSNDAGGVSSSSAETAQPPPPSTNNTRRDN